MRSVKHLAFVFFMLFIFTGNILAADVFLGGKTFYAFWDPYLKDIYKSFSVAEGEGWQKLDTGGGWMYGPTASVRLLEDLSLSVTYLRGTLQSKLYGTWHVIETERDTTHTGSGYAEVKRQDIDGAISYNIGSSFKVFAGYKYQPLDMKIKQYKYAYAVDTNNGNIYQRLYNIGMTFKSEYNAPALGIGYSVPFAGIFAFTINLSGLYIIGTTELERKQSFIMGINTVGGTSNVPTNPDESNTFKADMDINGWGYNIEPSIMAVMKENVLFILGFRYQSVILDGTMEVIQGDSEMMGAEIDMNDMNDSVYGVTFTALYKFEI